MGRRAAALVASLFIAVMEPVAWGMMVFSRGTEALTATGLWSLRYFTVLSNLLLGLASLVYAVLLVRGIRGGHPMPRWAHKLKYVATVAVAVTFMTVMLFLGPVFGFASMFAGANLWFHLVLPVLAIVEFALLDAGELLALRDTLLGVVPTLLYGIVYMGNILVNGVGQGAATNDWYGFTMWGVEFMPVVLAVMLLATWVFALAIRSANKLAASRR